MECNKENVKRSQLKSKIPLPVEPLPGISMEIVKKQVERRPFKILLDQTSNLPHGNTKKDVQKESKKKLRKSQSLTLDTRHVTMRPKNDSRNLDWNYQVFQDDGHDSVIYISDDEVIDIANSTEQTKYFDSLSNKNCLEKTKNTITPAVKEPPVDSKNSIRNIKKSLKRPHSKEVQGATSRDLKIKEEEKNKRRLKFTDRLHDLMKTPDVFKKIYADSFTRDYGLETFAYLLCKEDRWPRPFWTSTATRACILNWLLKVNGPDGNPAVIHTATWYLDSILAIGRISLEKLQLCATACYWIAQKIHGNVTTAQKLVKCSNNAFTSQHLLRAEKSILEKLKLPRQPIVPQEIVTFLSWWCDNNNPGEIELAATFICMSGLLLDMGLCREYPSVIGAAAVRNALLLLRRRDLLEKLEMCPIFEAIEQKSDLFNACAVQRKAVRMFSSPIFEYRVPFELYTIEPYNIPERILYEANYLAVVDTRIRPKLNPKQDKLFKIEKM